MKNKTTAALLAFFLGGIGIQYFYLGKHIKGVLCLLFCWTFIPCIVALYDFIKFLVMSEASFNAQYNRKSMLSMQPSIPVAPVTPPTRLVPTPTPTAPSVRTTYADLAPKPTRKAAISTAPSKVTPATTADELQQLFDLKHQGEITDDEYIIRKARLLT